MSFDNKTCRVQDLAEAGVLEIGDGYRAKNAELAENGLPFARAANINNGFHFSGVDRFPLENLHRVGNRVSRPGDVVFTSKGTVGRFAYVTPQVERFVYSPQLCFWRTLNPRVVDSRFLYYWMQGPEFMNQVEYLKGQTDMADYVSLRDQRMMTITIPPLAAQLQIASMLGALEDRLFSARGTSETLEAIARAISKSWFVDFDPVRAKAEGREPEGIDAETAALFPSELAHSELGLIPKGWRVGRFDELATLSKTTISPMAQPDLEFVHYSLPAYDAGQVPKPENGASIKSQKIHVPRDAILMSKLNPHIPRVWYVTNSSANAVCSTEFLPWVPISPEYKEYVYCLLMSPPFVSTVQTLVTGTSNSHQRVRADDVATLPVVIPPRDIVLMFAEISSPILSKVTHSLYHAQILAEVRDALLPRLISGRLQVLDVIGEIEEALAWPS